MTKISYPYNQIPDFFLSEVLRETVGGELTQENLETITELNANAKDIKKLKVLEYCTSLRIARFAGNQIFDISPLVGLENLTELDLSHNQRTESKYVGTRLYDEYTEAEKGRDADVMGRAVEVSLRVIERNMIIQYFLVQKHILKRCNVFQNFHK